MDDAECAKPSDTSCVQMISYQKLCSVQSPIMASRLYILAKSLYWPYRIIGGLPLLQLLHNSSLAQCG